jgi:group I intron endonuclease
VIDIYCHTSPSGKHYVGVAARGWRKRWAAHVKAATSGSPVLFHRAIRKYGADRFRTEVLAQCETLAEAAALERFWVAEKRTQAPYGYNLTAGGGGMLQPSQTTRDRMRAAALARRGTASEETRAKISAAVRGRQVSEETRAKKRAAALGRKHSPETCARIRAAKSQISEETRAKLRAANTGRKMPPRSPEHSAKIAAANSRRVWTAESREKSRAAALRQARRREADL